MIEKLEEALDWLDTPNKIKALFWLNCAVAWFTHGAGFWF